MTCRCGCGSPVRSTRSDARYASDACRVRRHRQAQRQTSGNAPTRYKAVTRDRAREAARRRAATKLASFYPEEFAYLLERELGKG